VVGKKQILPIIEKREMNAKVQGSDDTKKGEEVVLPGFRFHPTDEELVGFYLQRKVEKKPLKIELIKQVDIYKYDPWDLPSKICFHYEFVSTSFVPIYGGKYITICDLLQFSFHERFVYKTNSNS